MMLHLPCLPVPHVLPRPLSAGPVTQLEGQPVTNVYEMVLSEVEAPLLQVVMRVCNGNQCRAAGMMGLSRGTLRKKLQQHGML